LRGVRGAAWSSGRKGGSGAGATVSSVAREQGRAHGVRSEEREASAWAGPVQNEQSNFLFIKYIFYQFKFQMLQRMSSHGRKFSNKM
jgi:hypothetical protein